MPRYRSRSRSPLALIGFLLGALALAAPKAQSRDVYVLISGGMSPTENNYSQYLQARAYTKYLFENHPQDSVWVFYGAGNAAGKPPILADVIRRDVKAVNDSANTVANESANEDDEDSEADDGGRGGHGGQGRAVFVPGALPHNRPATREEIARAFREEIFPAVRDGGTLYLFVGDHGSPGNNNPPVMGDVPESVISLWSWERDPMNRFGWRAGGSGADLPVSQLRRWLTDGLGSGRVVFVMSQCFSGGFHYLGIPSQVAPNAGWFTRVPDWASAVKEVRNLPRVAGFTSTDENHIASGCTADVQADHWRGYERYLPENLIGLDLFTLQPAGIKRPSFYDAHSGAVDVDETIDLPRSTSEQYLAVWARTIARMAKDESVVHENIRPYLAAYRQTMDGAPPKVVDAAFNERAALFRRALEKMTASNPKVKDLLKAKESDLLEVMKKSGEEQSREEQARDQGTERPPSEHPPDDGTITDRQARAHLLEAMILPAWRHGIENGSVELPAPILAFERDLLPKQQSDDPAGPPWGVGEVIDTKSLAYWHSGYGDPQTFSEARAQQIDDWVRHRKRRIVEWAKTASDAKVRSMAEAYGAMTPPAKDARESEPSRHAHPDESSSGEENPPRATAALRIYFYRQVLAAWQFLLTAKESQALEQVASLTALERTLL